MGSLLSVERARVRERRSASVVVAFDLCRDQCLVRQSLGDGFCRKSLVKLPISPWTEACEMKTGRRMKNVTK